MKKLILLASAALLMASCGNQKTTDAPIQEQKPQVKLATVEHRVIDQIEEYTATVESDVKNNISSNTPLRIEKILVDVGDPVTAGQVLVQLDESTLNQLKIQIKNQEVEFNRIDQLYKIGGASKAEWDNARTQLDVNHTQLKNLLVNTTLRSPITGVVTARNYDAGDMASGPILTVEKVSPCKLNISMNEKYYPVIKKGMPISIQLDTYGDEQFEGRVTIVSPTIDATTHSFPVEITIPNAQGRVRPGMFARATVVYDKQDHILVPDEAIIKQVGAGNRYVYTYKDGKVYYKKVVLGRHFGTQYEIMSGIEVGSQIVVAGQSRLANEREVEVVK